jgi:hypothetical protein
MAATREAAVHLAEGKASVAVRWLKPIGRLLIPVAEKRYARRASRSILALYWQVRAAHPDMAGRELYAEVVAARVHTGPATARAILFRAEQSSDGWLTERDLALRDVAAYLAYIEFLQTHPLHHGTRTNMRQVAAKIIPHNL